MLHLQQHREQFIDKSGHFPGLGTGEAGQAHQQVFLHRQAPEDLPVLGHISDPGVNSLVGLERGNGLVLPGHAAFPDGQQTHQALEQCGLAHAVTAQQASDFADFDLKRQAAKNVAATVELMQILYS